MPAAQVVTWGGGTGYTAGTMQPHTLRWKGVCKYLARWPQDRISGLETHQMLRSDDSGFVPTKPFRWPRRRSHSL